MKFPRVHGGVVVVACLLLVVVCAGLGCGRRSVTTKTEVGPHGRVTVTRLQLTPEEIAERQRAAGYRPPPPADLAEIESIWPTLTPDQRASVLQTVKQMAAE